MQTTKKKTLSLLLPYLRSTKIIEKNLDFCLKTTPTKIYPTTCIISMQAIVTMSEEVFSAGARGVQSLIPASASWVVWNQVLHMMARNSIARCTVRAGPYGSECGIKHHLWIKKPKGVFSSKSRATLCLWKHILKT